jgi:hypothetical protein
MASKAWCTDHGVERILTVLKCGPMVGMRLLIKALDSGAVMLSLELSLLSLDISLCIIGIFDSLRTQNMPGKSTNVNINERVH